MICIKTVSKVRSWVKADGMSIKEVGRCTGLFRNTVRKYLRDGNTVPEYRMTKERRSRLSERGPQKSLTSDSATVRGVVSGRHPDAVDILFYFCDRTWCRSE